GHGSTAIRGTRIGSGPMGEEDHGHQAERQAISYWDAEGNEIVRYYAADVADEDIPEMVDHPQSGLPAGRDKENPPTVEKLQAYKSHLEYVKERRTDDEAVTLLEEALTMLREKRGE